MQLPFGPKVTHNLIKTNCLMGDAKNIGLNLGMSYV